MGLFSELRRRNVFRVAIAYVLIAWVILEAGDVLAPALHLPEWVVSALVFFLVLGFPLALIFAWAFELTPEGIKLEKHVDRGKSITRITGRKLDYLIIAVLALALTFLAFDKWVLEPSRDAALMQETTDAVAEKAAGSSEDQPASNSIAVMAFADLSPEGNQEYFSDGISEEILNALAHVPELHVISRSSAFSLKGKGLDIPTVAKRLGVASVLEGSVRKSGDRVRITAQLIDARTDSHVWSQAYDRELEDIFAVQDEISAAIVEALKKHFGLQVEASPITIATANREAHEAYLRGRYLVVQRTATSIEGAIREFEKAIALDPDYALAHAELAISTGLLSVYGGDVDRAEAVPYAERAMALDSTLAESHAAMGFVLDYHLSNFEEALTHYRQALQTNPNYSKVYSWMGVILYLNLGRYAEGFAAYETALRLDPLSIGTMRVYIDALIDRNMLDEADRELEKLAVVSPTHYAVTKGLRSSVGGNWANAVLGRLDGMLHDPNMARYSLTKHFATFGLDQEALALIEPPRSTVLRILGKTVDAVTAAEMWLARQPTSKRHRRDLAMALASAGDYARAKPILEEMWQRSGGRVVTYGRIEAEHAAALIAIRRAAGEEVGELLAAINDDVRRAREFGFSRVNLPYRKSIDFEEGLVAYLTGARDKGLALIAKAAADGYFILPNEAYLQDLYDDPGFAPIRESQEARQARERKKFLDVVCSDNPYAEVWQPAEGTCVQYVAEGGK